MILWRSVPDCVIGLHDSLLRAIVHGGGWAQIRFKTVQAAQCRLQTSRDWLVHRLNLLLCLTYSEK